MTILRQNETQLFASAVYDRPSAIMLASVETMEIYICLCLKAYAYSRCAYALSSTWSRRLTIDLIIYLSAVCRSHATTVVN